MNKEIANTIWTQMKAMDSNLCMCMGITGLAVIDRGLEFKVSGLSFKGTVQIVLNGGDLYDVRLVKITKKLNKDIQKQYGIKKYDMIAEVLKETKDVFVDDLMPLLENQIENRKAA